MRCWSRRPVRARARGAGAHTNGEECACTLSNTWQSRRVVSTGDDKKLFVWEYGIGTAPMKHVSEPWMHSMPSMTCAPLDDGDPKYMLGQSMDNQILVYQCGDRFKLNKKKHFVGHTVAGTACQIGASPDMKYVISGGTWTLCLRPVLYLHATHPACQLCARLDAVVQLRSIRDSGSSEDVGTLSPGLSPSASRASLAVRSWLIESAMI